jgi:CheY-like chemotaxis protein
VIARRGVIDNGIAFLHKSFSPVELAGKVREVLGTKESDVVKVLLAEDSAPVRKLLARILQEGGCAVVQASDGLEALEHLQKQTVHVALLDTNMPRMGGVAAAQEIRRQHPEIKIILMSAAYEASLNLNPATVGVDALLPKPVLPKVLLETVRTLAGLVKAIPK